MKKTLNGGHVLLFDDQDLDLFLSGTWVVARNWNTFYARGSSGKFKDQSFYRILMGATKSQLIDHKNRNGLDCRRCNLRFATNAQNSANSRKRPSSIPFRGVGFDKRCGIFYARIGGKKNNQFLGCFRTAEQAAIAYDKAAIKYYGEFASLNNPRAALAKHKAQGGNT